MDEGKSRKKQEYEGEVESKLLDQAYVVFERYEKKKEIITDFYVLKYKAMASFGKEIDEIFNKTSRVVNKLFVSAHMLGTHYWPRQGRVKMTEEEFKKHIAALEKHESIFWDMYQENDEIRNELAEILINLEKVTKPCFEQPSTLYYLMTKKLFGRK